MGRARSVRSEEERVSTLYIDIWKIVSVTEHNPYPIQIIDESIDS